MIKYPPTPPPWLGQWLSREDFKSRFSQMMVSGCQHLITAESSLSLNWTQNQLLAHIGRHTATWTMGENGTWSVECTCSFPNPHCVHACGADYLLALVCRMNGWNMPGNVFTPKRPAATAPSSSSGPTSRYSQSDFLSDAVRRPSQAAKLEVEADFKHEAGMVGIRFYYTLDSIRNLFTLMQLRNNAYQVKQGQETRLKWSEADALFLQWLLPRLREVPLRLLSMKMLKLSLAEFQDWQRHWQRSDPPRFIDKDSQEFIRPDGVTVPASLQFVLHDEGEWIRVDAQFTLTNGLKKLYHEIYEIFTGNAPLATRHLLDNYTPPVPWSLLNEFFKKKSPRMQRRAICAHLKKLVNNRLDLVTGSCVRHVHDLSEKLQVTLSQDNNEFRLMGYQNGSPIRLDSTFVPAKDMTVTEENGLFIIHDNSGKEGAQLRDLLLQLGDRGNREQDGVTLPAKLANTEPLREFWSSLPQNVDKLCTPDVDAVVSQNSLYPKMLINVETHGGLVTFAHSVLLGKQTISCEDFRRNVRAKMPLFRLSTGQWLSMDLPKAEALLKTMEEQNLTDVAQTVLSSEAKAKFKAIEALEPELMGNRRQFREMLSLDTVPQKPPLPQSLLEVLRPYQKVGVDYLADRCLCGAGAILADDMGLGKTLQLLSLLYTWKQQLRENEPWRVLVICPASVMDVWQRQAQQFRIPLNIILVKGTPQTRAALLQQSGQAIFVTHYSLARQDIAALAAIPFDFVILDEAQSIKNPDAQITRAVKTLKAEHRLAMTGTPIENHLMDLWSIMDFLNPGYLGTRETFAATYTNTPESLADLSRKLAPVLLRRTKEVVAPELPPRTEACIRIAMNEKQRQLYDHALAAARVTIQSQGDGHGQTQILTALLRLRQICCDPALVFGEDVDAPSAKLETLLEHLDELTAAGHSVLVFSQFASMLDIIAKSLFQRNIQTFTITGDTPVASRPAIISAFNNCPAPAVFLLSLKAAGTGLTLTKADYVFLYDPWWNPAVENQAIDRTHRIGQNKAVFAYRLIMEDSIEEKVLELLAQKQELFRTVVDSATAQAQNLAFSLAEIQELLL